MSYLEQPEMSNRKMVALAIAVLIHVFLGYAFVTGLALKVVKKIVEPIETVNIEEEEPLEEPPPPPEQIDIPVVAPPPDVVVDTPPPPTALKTETTVVAPVPIVAAPVAPAPPVITAPPPPPPPPKPAQAVEAKLKGNRLRLITNDDYPDRAARAEEEGTTAVEFEVNEQGRVENCRVTSSSGSTVLDETTCTLITRRFRYEPAKDSDGNPIRVKKADRVKWVLPQ